LLEGQRNFQRVGASEPRLVQNCRAPTPADKRDPRWRPIDLASDNIEAPPSGVELGTAYPDDDTALYYWREGYWRGRA
jgi:hypothetical protein